MDLREILNAIRYLARAGCGWRMLPTNFGPWQTVYWWFRRFVRRLLFRTLHDVALMLDRERVGREASPTAMLSLTDETGDDDGEAGGRMLDLVSDTRATDPRQAQHQAMVKDALFRTLNEKERIVIQYYYYEGLSMREIAGMLKLTESRVCQIHSKVITRLREMYANRKKSIVAARTTATSTPKTRACLSEEIRRGRMTNVT